MGMGDVRAFTEAFEEEDTVLTDDAVMEAQETQDDRDALTIIRDTLATYGLEGLAGDAYRFLMEGASTDSVMIQLKETDVFKERFKGLELRRQQGLPAISPAEYIRLERDYRQTMAAAGLPEGFYDNPDDFADFIGNDVSPAEMTQRVSMATTAVSNVNPELKNQLREMYGIGTENDGELIAYFLDPDRGVNVIEQRLQMESAGLSAAAIQATGQGIGTGVARQLAGQNVQQREISQRLSQQAGLTQQVFGEQNAVTSTELAAASFGLDSESTAQVRRLRQRRQAAAEQRAGGLVTGMGATGLGSAQN
tara:strand:- start:2086 stop:3009 length:924 start_codon:yes stop_codon:yes gene_type:complete